MNEKGIALIGSIVPNQGTGSGPNLDLLGTHLGSSGPAEGLAAHDPLRIAAEAARRYASKSQAPNTKAAYIQDWKHFVRWCRAHELPAMPASPSTVMLYIASISDGWNGEPPKKPSTVVRRLAAINAFHKRAGKFLPASQKHPEISVVLQGILRDKGTAQIGKKPLNLRLATLMLERSSTREPIAMARDKVILLLGLAGAFRRSELAAIDLQDMSWHRDGITIRICRSKTDQLGKGREVEIPYGSDPATCPVLAVERWLGVSGIDRSDHGPLLRPVRKGGAVVAARLNPYSIGYIIRKMAEDAGLNDRTKRKYLYSAHSLRAGFVTAAEAGGATERQIMRQTGHKSRQMIDRYSRREQEDRRAAAQKVGF